MTNKEIGEGIRHRRRSRGWSQEQLGDIIGVATSTISMYERGERRPLPDIVDRLADAFNIPAWSLLYTEDEVQPITKNLQPLRTMMTHTVPLIGSVAAGEPIIAEENYDIFVDSPILCDYALRIQGDSMTPNYQDGDVVYIRVQPDVDDGQVAVVLVDDTATLKHVYHLQNGLLLISDNPDYKPMHMTYDEYDVIRILGIPCGFTRMFKTKLTVTKGFSK